MRRRGGASVRSAVRPGEILNRHAPTRPQRDDAILHDRCRTGISSAYALHTIICVDTRPLECRSGRAPPRRHGQRCVRAGERTRRRDRSATMQYRAIDVATEYRVHMHCTRYYVSILARSSVDPVALHRAGSVSGACGRPSARADATAARRCNIARSMQQRNIECICIESDYMCR